MKIAGGKIACPKGSSGGKCERMFLVKRFGQELYCDKQRTRVGTACRVCWTCQRPLRFLTTANICPCIHCILQRTVKVEPSMGIGAGKQAGFAQVAGKMIIVDGSAAFIRLTRRAAAGRAAGGLQERLPAPNSRRVGEMCSYPPILLSLRELAREKAR